MVPPVIHRGWCDDPEGLLAALRTQYGYTARQPDRATGWLFCSEQAGQLMPVPWPEPLAEHGDRLIRKLELEFGIRFTAACFQAYLDGSGCGWHHDRDWDEQAVLSLGATRKFGVRTEDTEMYFELEDGDLLLMPSGFQYEWEHCVPEEDTEGERCSLVFRSPLS